MPRPTITHLGPDRWHASLGRRFLGTFPTPEAAQEALDAILPPNPLPPAPSPVSVASRGQQSPSLDDGPPPATDPYRRRRRKPLPEAELARLRAMVSR